MCLWVDLKATRKFKAKYKNDRKSTIKVYKELRFQLNFQNNTIKIITPYRGTQVTNFELIADLKRRPKPSSLRDGQSMYYGIHAYTIQRTNTIECIVPVKDVIAIGLHNEILLTKLKFNKLDLITMLATMRPDLMKFDT